MASTNTEFIKITKCTLGYDIQLIEVSEWLHKMRKLMRFTTPKITDEAAMFRSGLYLRHAGLLMDTNWYDSLLFILKNEPDTARIHMEKARKILQAAVTACPSDEQCRQYIADHKLYKATN